MKRTGVAFREVDRSTLETRCYRLLYEMLRGGDQAALRVRLVRDSPDAQPDLPDGRLVQKVCFGEIVLFREAALGGGTDVRDVFDRDGLLDTCWAGLGARIAERIEGVKHTFSLPGGGFVVECPDVLAALYWQFACLVAGKRQVGLCEGCGGHFEKRRRDLLYCSSTCRSRGCRSRKKKEGQDDDGVETTVRGR